MFEHLDNADLTWQELLEKFRGSIALLDNLDGDVSLVTFGEGQLHRGVGTLAEHLQDAVAVVFKYRMLLLFACCVDMAGWPFVRHDCHALLAFCVAVIRPVCRTLGSGLLIFRSTVLVILCRYYA